MGSDRMKIALVSSSYHPHFGGVEEHVRHVANGLQARGHAVEVWTVDRGDGLRDEIVDGCRVRYLPTPLPARSVRAVAALALRAPEALARWVGAYVAFRPDVINVQCFGPNGVYGLILAQLTGAPLVVSSHGETVMDEHSVYDNSALLRAALRRATHASRAVTACSQFIADDLRARFGAPAVLTIPNGVRRETVPNGSPASLPRSQRGRYVLIGVGRLVPQKGFDVLLRAAAQSHHQPEVWIVGEGAERERLEALAASLSISGWVTFVGRRTPEQIQGLMAQADVVVVPSRVEPFGIVVLEAWASGTPVLATGHGGPSSFVTDGYDGLLVDPADLPSMASTIDRVLSDAELAERLAGAGRLTVESFTWDRVVNDYCQIYRTAKI